MNIVRILPDNVVEKYTNIITNKIESFAYGVTDKTCILKGSSSMYNYKFIEDNNILFLDLGNEGGTLVLSQGDIEIGIFRFDGWKDNEKLSKYILDYLKTKIPNVEIVGNDFIVDGIYKVGSFSSRNLSDRFIYSGMHLSMNVDLELIKQVCTKPMIKIPKGLIDYGITTEEIQDVIEQFVSNEVI